MKSTGLSGKWEKGTKTVRVNVPVMIFQEDNVHIAYVPNLDISGYGLDEEEAKQSLAISLDEYFTYTHNKNSLLADLKAHGWTIVKKSKPFVAPELSKLLSSNVYLQDIFDSRKYTMDRMDLAMPQYATC